MMNLVPQSDKHGCPKSYITHCFAQMHYFENFSSEALGKPNVPGGFALWDKGNQNCYHNEVYVRR